MKPVRIPAGITEKVEDLREAEGGISYICRETFKEGASTFGGEREQLKLREEAQRYCYLHFMYYRLEHQLSKKCVGDFKAPSYEEFTRSGREKEGTYRSVWVFSSKSNGCGF